MTDVVLSLLAILACRESPRMVALCAVYAGIRLAFILVAPLPAGVIWYALCFLGELTVVLVALRIRAAASDFMAWMSILGMFVHAFAALEYPTTFAVVYTAYPYVMNYFVEAAQVACLYVFSPPGLRYFAMFWQPKNKKGGGSWMQARWMLHSR